MSSAPATYCNPLPIPEYPRGKYTFGAHRDPANWGWLQREPRDFRELADPSVIFQDGRWYLYPSCGMAWVSEDFVTWTHHRIEPFDFGYAPTVVAHEGRFLMTTSGGGLWQAEHPLGPWRELGAFRDPEGKPLERWMDPMIFADDDGRLYLYWGLGQPGIFGAELDAAQPTRLITKPRVLFSFDPAHVWERAGDHNESTYHNCNEGAWMVKVGDTYYLTYTAPGTEWKTYGLGAYRAKSPLGPFVYDESNPFCAKSEGLVQGPGHGCIVRGPGETLWAFYTLRVCYEHAFERRIGMDPVHVHADGRLSVKVTETPQRAPGAVKQPGLGNEAGWLPVTYRRRAVASSEAPGRSPFYAVDQSMVTWWQPAVGDRAPWIEMDLGPAPFRLHALRLVWKDVGLDYEKGVGPGPFRWRLLVKTREPESQWAVALDASGNATDLLVDYRELPNALVAQRARIEIVGWPAGITPGLVDCALFGVAVPKK